MANRPKPLTCSECAAWEPLGVEGTFGTCRRYAPRLYDTHGNGIFARTEANEWCADFLHDLPQNILRKT